MKIRFLNKLGPGLLFAGAAIGVSHLVQSTKAGATFGYGLLWALLLVHVFKYPFFQFGPRYTAATGETLLDGYKKISKSVLGIYYILNLASMFTIQAAVTIVTAGLASQLFGITDNLVVWSILILVISLLILAVGKYNLLDNLMKYIIITLTISTIIAVCIAFIKTNTILSYQQILPNSSVEIAFLIAFLGWMPAPLDVSIWHSIWAVEKNKIIPHKISKKAAIYDFNIGYVGTLFLGVCFLSLGSLVMYNTGASFSNIGGVFASQLINLYTSNLGGFSYFFIAIAAFTTMFSTTITTLDASPRAMHHTTKLLFNNKNRFGYWFWSILLTIGTFIILQFFKGDMGFLVKIATILSFLTAPFYAVLNYLLITGKHTPKAYQPKILLRVCSWFGIVFLISFSVWFLISL